MTRVGIFGADGKMGRLVCSAVDAERDLELVAAVDPSSAGEDVGGGVTVAERPEALSEAGAEVARLGRQRLGGLVSPGERRVTCENVRGGWIFRASERFSKAGHGQS